MNLPATANCHSHAFHRALRGRRPRGADFWGWRKGMYEVAGRLDPERYHRLARAVYAEMRLAGYDAVGEFHYLHLDRTGVPYSDPHAMSEALIAAAEEVGLRICLLRTHYARAGFGEAEPDPVQRRFIEPLEVWQQRAVELAARHRDSASVVVGAAIHSVRAVPAESFEQVAGTLADAPLHVHVSEQPEENRACREATGLTPVRLLAEAGVWSSRTTAVHATHLESGDIEILGGGGATVCFCPTTEAELADGIGPSAALRRAGVPLSIGSDSNTVVDPFAELRGLAMHERLATGSRDGWQADQLWQVAGAHRSLGLTPGGVVEVADSVRTAGTEEPVWAVSAADVVPPADLDPHEVAAELAAVVSGLWEER